MSAPQFTPGPWEVMPQEDDRLYVRVRGTRLGERYKIANALFAIDDRHEKREALANARLIAAAPELCEKGKALLEAAERHIFGDECKAERDAFRAALAKAAGQ